MIALTQWFSSKRGLKKAIREKPYGSVAKVRKLKQTKRAQKRRGAAAFCKYSLSFYFPRKKRILKMA